MHCISFSQKSMTQVCHVVVDNTHPAKGGQSMSVFILLLVELWHLFLGHMMYVIGDAVRGKKDSQTAFSSISTYFLKKVQPPSFTFSLEVTSDQFVILNIKKISKSKKPNDIKSCCCKGRSHFQQQLVLPPRQLLLCLYSFTPGQQVRSSSYQAKGIT